MVVVIFCIELTIPLIVVNEVSYLILIEINVLKPHSAIIVAGIFERSKRPVPCVR